MTQASSLVVQKKGYVKSSLLLLIAFSTAFLSRLLDTAGAPSFINFAHFFTVPAAVLIALQESKSRDYRQIGATQELLLGLGIFLSVEIASAIANNAGFINIILSFLLLTEPFLFLLGIICIPLESASLDQLKKWSYRFLYFHIALALLQKVLIDIGVLKITTMSVPEDNIQGVFYLSGGGHVVGASVSISFGLYYLINAKSSPLWMRVAVFFASFLQLLFADAKQVLLVCLLAWILLIITNLDDVKTTFKYVFSAIFMGIVLTWCIQNLELFRAFKTWIRPEIYGPEGEATLLKGAAFRIVSSHYEFPLHWLFGLGPGHTVGRLGGWMMEKYWSLLAPLGATAHPASKEAWDAVWASWIGPASSMFSPLFGWAGIWGDLGFLGIFAYLYLWSIVWRRFCENKNFSKFLILTVFVNGLVFTQMEEPGFMLFIIILIALPWHEQRLKRIAAIKK